MTFDLETIIKTVLAIIALATFWKAIYEYMQQRLDKRAQQFIALRNYFRDNQGFQIIIERLYTPGSNFDGIPLHTKIEFMAFFEDLAFLMNSGLIKKHVVFYMFGGDAIAAYHRNDFWSEKLRNDKFWGLLTDFVNQMDKLMKDFKKEPFENHRHKISL